MQTLPEHYRDFPGLDKSWRAVKVDLEHDPAEVRREDGPCSVG